MKSVETLYDHLGVSPLATVEEIRNAFRRLARETHPDKNPSLDALRRFKSAAEAYNILMDPVRRRAYDRGRDCFGSLADFFTKHPAANRVMTRMLPSAKASMVPGRDILRPATSDVTRYTLHVSRTATRGYWIRFVDQGEPGKNGAEPGDAWMFVAPEKMRK